MAAGGCGNGYAVKVPNGKVVGAAVIDYPSYLLSTWHNSRTLWMVNPVIALSGACTSSKSCSPLMLFDTVSSCTTDQRRPRWSISSPPNSAPSDTTTAYWRIAA